MIADVVFELYEEAGVFNACDKPDWKETTPELSKKLISTLFIDEWKKRRQKWKENEVWK